MLSRAKKNPSKQELSYCTVNAVDETLLFAGGQQYEDGGTNTACRTDDIRRSRIGRRVAMTLGAIDTQRHEHGQHYNIRHNTHVMSVHQFVDS